jgi:hypothetical protein
MRVPRNAYRYCVGKPLWKWPHGTLRGTWDTVELGLKDIRCEDEKGIKLVLIVFLTSKFCCYSINGSWVSVVSTVTRL